ncbi:MAG: hypothetical protein ABI627_02365 [Polyangiaceae bacterium]
MEKRHVAMRGLTLIVSSVVENVASQTHRASGANCDDEAGGR